MENRQSTVSLKKQEDKITTGPGNPDFILGKEFEPTSSEKKVLQDGFFKFIELGKIEYVDKWLERGWIDVLQENKDGLNVLQIVCVRSGLSEKRCYDEDFNPRLEMPENMAKTYLVLKKYYDAEYLKIFSECVKIKSEEIKKMDSLNTSCTSLEQSKFLKGLLLLSEDFLSKCCEKLFGDRETKTPIKRAEKKENLSTLVSRIFSKKRSR